MNPDENPHIPTEVNSTSISTPPVSNEIPPVPLTTESAPPPIIPKKSNKKVYVVAAIIILLLAFVMGGALAFVQMQPAQLEPTPAPTLAPIPVAEDLTTEVAPTDETTFGSITKNKATGKITINFGDCLASRHTSIGPFGSIDLKIKGIEGQMCLVDYATGGEMNWDSVLYNKCMIPVSLNSLEFEKINTESDLAPIKEYCSS